MAHAALLLSRELEREAKLSYKYPPFWPSQKMEVGLKQMSTGQAGKIEPSLW